MTLPETLHLILALLAVVCCSDCFLKLCLRHSHRNHCHVVFFLLYLKSHLDVLLDNLFSELAYYLQKRHIQ